MGLALLALACNGDDAPAPTATERTATGTPLTTSDESPPPAAKGWRTLAPMPTPRSEVAVAAVGGKIYVVGGFEGDGSTSDAVEVYDPVTDTWTQAPPLPEGRHHTAAVGVGGVFLYVIGGFGRSFNDPQTNVYRFDTTVPGAGWEERAPLPTARGGHALVGATCPGLTGACLYAIGGSDAGQGNVSAVEVYQDVTNSWTTAANLLTPRDHLAAANTVICAADLCATGLFAIGGRVNVDFGRNLDVNEEYEFGADNWMTRAPLPTARSGIATAFLGRKIYVFGGEGSEGTFDENEAYDVENDSWETLEPMPTARHGLGAAVVGGTIYVIGGGPTPGLSVSGANEAFTP